MIITVEVESYGERRPGYPGIAVVKIDGAVHAQLRTQEVYQIEIGQEYRTRLDKPPASEYGKSLA